MPYGSLCSSMTKAMTVDHDESPTERAYRRLRSDLIRCRLAAGSRLEVSSLRENLHVGEPAIRQALARLTAEGLVTIERNAGFRAACISPGHFRDLAAACATNEVACLQSALENGNLEWESALLADFHIASKVLDRVIAGEEDISAYISCRQVFDETLLSPCDNGWMLWSWQLLYAQHMRYRQTFQALSIAEFDLKHDFTSFLAQVLARNVVLASKACRDDYRKLAIFAERRAATMANLRLSDN
jgi:GntR family carbon starvation induced transcriptional regulator